MTLKLLRDQVKKWDLRNPDDDPDAASKYQSILNRLEWFGSKEWSEYLPTQNPAHSSSYLVRLADWIGNVEADSDQQLMLEYALYVSYFSHEDITTLYQTAFSGAITRWIVKQEGLSLSDSEFQSRITDELHNRTWYCPVTESMNISEFYHINLITGIPNRPCFRDAWIADCKSRKRKELNSQILAGFLESINNPNPNAGAPPLKRLVLLEDFVGSGTQCAATIIWAARNLLLPILYMPLIICAPGLEKLAKIAKTCPSNLEVIPLLTLPERDLLGPKRNGVDGIPNALQIEKLAHETFERVAGGPHDDDHKAPHTAFGYNETGSSFVSYSNTPNNTLPMIHHKPKAGGWRPLFPRSSRV